MREELESHYAKLILPDKRNGVDSQGLLKGLQHVGNNYIGSSTLDDK